MSFVWILKAIFALLFVIQGVIFIMLSVKVETGIAVLDKPNGQVLFMALGAFWCGLGLWALLRKRRLFRDRSEDDIRRGLARTKAIAGVELMLGVALIVVAFGDGLTGGAVEVKAAGFFITFGIFTLLRGLWLWASGSTTPAEAKGTEAMFVAQDARKDKLAELSDGRGVPARATIVEFRRKGMGFDAGVEEGEFVEIDLKITSNGAAPYTAMWSGPLSYLYAGRLVPGGSVPIRVHPADPQVFEIDWNKG